MKGIILAGGEGTRLYPLTKVASKQLLPVYDQPMIYYPLQTLLKAGIEDILIIVAPDRSGDFLNLLGSGSKFGARFAYEIQDKPEGIAQAFLIAEEFINGDSCALILGDNIFMENLSVPIHQFKNGAMIFCKEVSDPERFGVVEMDSDGRVLGIEEKPKDPKSHYAQTGLYVYDSSVVQMAKSLKPSARGEYEITDLNNLYLKQGKLSAHIVQDEWIDAGTFESLFRASSIMREKALSKASSLLQVSIKKQITKKKSITV